MDILNNELVISRIAIAIFMPKDMGIPYSIAPETQVKPNYTRGTMKELYEKINDDIEEALPLVNDEIYSVPKYHFNKKAAYAFGARFNLYYLHYSPYSYGCRLSLGLQASQEQKCSG